MAEEQNKQNKKNRKSPEQIKNEILYELSEEPSSIENLRKKIQDSNWSTIKRYLEELESEGVVKEAVSTGKIKIYQKITEDTYFSLPITEEQGKKFRTLFSMIINEYKRKGKIPTKTHLAKCAVEVIEKDDKELNDLPVIWYLYGLIPQMVADPSKEYEEEVALKNRKNILALIRRFINEKGEKPSWVVQNEQHKKHEEELYEIADEFFRKTNKERWHNEEIVNLLNQFFISCPVDKGFPEIFEITENLFSVINKLSKIAELENYRNKILLTFNSLWKFIALYKLYKSKSTGKNHMSKEALNFFLGDELKLRKESFYESFSDLESEYLSKLAESDPNKIELSEDAENARKIMEDWTGED